MKRVVSLIIAVFVVGFVGTAQATPSYFAGTGHWYDVIWTQQTISWDDAKTAAEGLGGNLAGGHLATITDAAENAFVWGLVESLAISLQVDTEQFWLGGYQTSSANEPAGDWAWVTGEAWGYTNWAANEPNNGVGGTQDYLHFWPGNGLWDDMENRSIMMGYVVESPVPEPATILLLGAGLLSVFGFGRRRFKK